MRLCTSASLCLAAAAALLAPAAPAALAALAAPAAPAQAEDGTRTAPYAAAPACAAHGGPAFPLTARIEDGPGTYRPGGGYGVWYVALTNTTDRVCAGVHPVVVLADRDRVLRPGQARLDFYADGRPHPVHLESTDEDELVGAFADDAAGFPGFSVGPGRTVRVRVRLALSADTAPNEVTVTAAVVQRRDDDGEWVGRSNDYRFTVRPGPDRPDGAHQDSGVPATPPAPDASGGTDASAEPDTSGTASAPPRTERFPSPAELAGTGPSVLPAVLAAGGALLLAGGAVLARNRGRR